MYSSHLWFHPSSAIRNCDIRHTWALTRLAINQERREQNSHVTPQLTAAADPSAWLPRWRQVEAPLLATVGPGQQWALGSSGPWAVAGLVAPFEWSAHQEAIVFVLRLFRPVYLLL